MNDGSIQNGRGLITSGLIIMLVKINEKTSERAIASPHLRVCLKQRNATVSNIQNIPALPSKVMAFIIVSRTGVCIASNQWSNDNSHAIVKIPFRK